MFFLSIYGYYNLYAIYEWLLLIYSTGHLALGFATITSPPFQGRYGIMPGTTTILDFTYDNVLSEAYNTFSTYGSSWHPLPASSPGSFTGFRQLFSFMVLNHMFYHFVFSAAGGLVGAMIGFNPLELIICPIGSSQGFINHMGGLDNIVAINPEAEGVGALMFSVTWNQLGVYSAPQQGIVGTIQSVVAALSAGSGWTYFGGSSFYEFATSVVDIVLLGALSTYYQIYTHAVQNPWLVGFTHYQQIVDAIASHNAPVIETAPSVTPSVQEAPQAEGWSWTSVILIFLAVVLAFGGGYYYFSNQQSEESEEE